jgi:hypothetical protein
MMPAWLNLLMASYAQWFCGTSGYSADSAAKAAGAWDGMTTGATKAGAPNANPSKTLNRFVLFCICSSSKYFLVELIEPKVLQYL